MSSAKQDVAVVNDTSLPIRSVILYTAGVAYVEREGPVNADAKINLAFRSTDMNDVLKSLTVLDLGGGIISSISYAANRSIQDQLNDIMLRIPHDHSLTGLLNQLKGSKVKVVTLAGQELEGVVLGIQSFNEQLATHEVEKPHISLLIGGSKIVTLSITDLKNFTILEDHIKKDIQYLLNVMIGSKKKDSKQLTIHASGKGDRTVYLSYIISAPLWKTSYRLLFETKDSDKKDAKKECLIQGWAVIDNTMDEDWTNVKLSLVSGLPVSFTHDLYNPRYKKRPVVEVKETEPSYGAPVLGGDSHKHHKRDHDALMRSIDAELSKPKPKMGESTAVVVRNVEAGDLFHYDIKHAVTVRRNGAALVPIYTGKTQAEKLLVFNKEIRDKNPMSSILFKNTTGIALQGGPITVLEDDNYVGEAMLDTLRPNDDKMLPYSVELGVVVNIDNTTGQEKVHEVYISSGYMYQYFWRTQQTTYSVVNKTDKKHTLIIEHRFNKSYELYDTPAYIEKTDNFMRFKLEIEPKKTTPFIVKEKYLETHSEYLSSITGDRIQKWIVSNFIDKELEEKLQAFAAITKKIYELQNEKIQTTNKEVQLIHSNQARVRENLKVLNDDDAKLLRQRYIKRLEREEDQLNRLNADIKKFTEEVNALNTEYTTKLKQVSFRKKLNL